MFLKRYMQILLGLVAAVVIAGCVAPRTYQMATPFDESEFAPYAGEGTSTIQGQAFLKTRGGEVRYAAGNVVTLIPDTEYTRAVSQYTRFGLRVHTDPRWHQYIRQTIADGSGNFTFENIPSGAYILECPIFWEVPGQYGLQSTGSVVKKQVKVAPGETLKVVLTL